MKKLITILFLFVFAHSFGQIPNAPRSSPFVQATDARVKFSLNMSMPVVSDTAHGLNGGNDSLGLQILSLVDTSVYVRITSSGLSHKWIKLLKLGDASAGGLQSINVGSLAPLFSTTTTSCPTCVVTYTLNNAGAHLFWGNNTGSSTQPNYVAIGIADLPTAIPNGNLANSSLGFSIGSSGSSPNFAASPVSLGGNVVLNMPNSSGVNNGILPSTDWNTFNNKQQGLQFQNGGVNIGTLGAVNTINFTGAGVAASFSGGVVTVTIAGGGGGSGLTSLNGLTNSTQAFATGTGGTDFNINSSVSTHTFNMPFSSPTTTGKLANTDWINFNAKISPSDTSTMLASYLINLGNLNPLFTANKSGHNVTFAQQNAAANTILANNTGGSAAPAFVTPLLTGSLFSNQGTATTVLHGNAAGNLAFAAVNLALDVTGVLAATNGGTGQSSYTTGALLVASSSTALTQLNDITVGNVLLSGGVGTAPSYGKVNLASMITGILPIGNIDTANAFFHTSVAVRNLGSVGDSLAYVIGGNTLGFRRVNFSTGLSVVHNADSSLTVTSSGAAGTGGYSIRDTIACTACAFVIGDNVTRISTGAGYAKTDTINNTLYYGKVSQVFNANSFEVTTYGRMLWTSGLTVSAPAYQSTTAGNSTNTSPVISIYIGEALSSTVFFVDRSARPFNFAGGGGGSGVLALSSPNGTITYSASTGTITSEVTHPNLRPTTTISANGTMVLAVGDQLSYVYIDPASNETVSIGTTLGGSDVLFPTALVGGTKNSFFLPIRADISTTLYFSGVTSSTVVTLIKEQ